MVGSVSSVTAEMNQTPIHLYAVVFGDGFYCAMLCASAVFAVGCCLSVRLYVTLVYRIQTAKDIVKLLSRPGSHITLVS